MTGPDDRTDRPIERNAPIAPFPPEDGWLDLEPPTVGADFVGRTLAVLRDAGVLDAAADAGSDHGDGDPLPSELMATYRVPPAGANFVERTLQHAQQARADQWRRLLLRYDAPAPTADFVARTLAALQTARPPGARSRSRSGARPWGPVLLAAAAAALLLVLLRPARQEPLLRELVADADLALAPSLAVSRSPAVLSHLLAAIDDAGAGDRGALPVHPADGGWLWLAAAEAGR
jgi:hypothetical protein